MVNIQNTDDNECFKWCLVWYINLADHNMKRKRHIKDCFEINGKQTIKMPKKGEHVTFKNFERKANSPFMIYADFESILVPEDNGKQDPNESYINKYQQHVFSSFGYKLVCVDDKFSKPFKSYWCKDAAYDYDWRKLSIVVMWWKIILAKNLRWLNKKRKIFRT